MKNSKVLVILGPTAIGKTKLGLSLAKRFSGELVACDSRQVYKGLRIGTGKGSEKVIMYDVADPKKQYSVAVYVKNATQAINGVLERGRLPIIVGGTGLYLRGLLGEIPDIHVPRSGKLRKSLSGLSVQELQRRVAVLSPTAFEGMNTSDRVNERRLIRKIEIVSMYPYTNNISKLPNSPPHPWDVLKIGLSAPRPLLNSRIDSRLASRVNQGLIKEAEELYKNGLSLERMKDLGLEYGVLADLLKGNLGQDEFVDKLRTKIHQYAKRQMAWFKKEAGVHWFDITEKNLNKAIVNEVENWYNAPCDQES